MRRAVLCPVLDAAQRTHAGPSNGPASHASVTTADHVSAGDCASISTVTRGVAGVADAAAVAGAASLRVPAGLGPGCAPSKFRPSPADPCCCCSRCHRTRPLPSLRCPFQNSVVLPPALPSLRPTLPPGMSVHRPSRLSQPNTRSCPLASHLAYLYLALIGMLASSLVF
jgi:hypothetical protein